MEIVAQSRVGLLHKYPFAVSLMAGWFYFRRRLIALQADNNHTFKICYLRSSSRKYQVYNGLRLTQLVLLVLNATSLALMAGLSGYSYS